MSLPAGRAVLALAFWLSAPLIAEQPTPTFATHVAKIVHQRCAYCHHEGQSAPFNLLTYDDVKKRADTIRKVIEQGIMPPWLAEPGHGEFANDRRLSPEEKSTLLKWLAAGAPEGDPKLTPAPPTWQSGWLEGTPDLVVKMEKAYELGPEGPDVYRHFAIPLSVTSDRYVRAIEFAPGNARVVHHAFIRLDEEGLARKLEGRDGAPGFDQMVSGARMPGGQFLTWNPGSRPVVAPKGMAWKLPKNSDFVIEMHLNRTGKPESLQSAIGIYFTDEKPTNQCYTFKLGSFALDFPAGATNEIIRDSFVLPVDIDLLAVYPHAHFLAREMKAYAIRPDGAKEWLVWIKHWDFNWQGDYRYKTPLHLTKGTTLHIEYAYDNSTNNAANPHHPPQRVLYGEKSNDEMCELGLQLVTRSAADLNALQEAASKHRLQQSNDALRLKLSKNPDDAESLTRLGMNLWVERKRAEAEQAINRAIELRPDFAEAHYNRGVFLRFTGRAADGVRAFETALKLDPKYPRAYQQMAFAYAELGDAPKAEASFVKALEVNPADTTSRDSLNQLRQYLKNQKGAGTVRN